MRILKLNALCGVKNQMYCTDQYVDADRVPNIRDGFFDINSLFWSKILAPQRVREILSLAMKRLEGDFSPKVRAVLQMPETFFETYIEAMKALETPVTDQVLFQSLETLEIICYLYSKIYSKPFILTLSEGYVHSKFSALDLLNVCLLPFCNPYLPFVEDEIIPRIVDYQPDILLLTGKPNIASFAIAKIIRERLPNSFIVATEHESDYYSLKKIKHLLISNTALFSVYHCVVLNDTTETLECIKQAFSKGPDADLSSIPGIIYSTDNGNTIFYTADNPKQSSPDTLPCIDENGNNVLNIRAFPQNCCYWNKCTFCGINSKFGSRENKTWDVDSFITKIKTLYAAGVKKVWLLDEAIPVSVIRNLAEQILSNDIHIIWHMRTRIEPCFAEDTIAKLLWQAGLRHILFGFESASDRILRLAQKMDGNFNYLEVAENIVHNFTTNKIAVHFSAILGFPTETKQERQETCDFLKYITNTYVGFTYNVNTFYLDVGSEMYNRWECFDISSLSYPCAPKYFLENHLDWNSAITPDKFVTVHKEQEQVMEQQYPWFPKGTLLTPSVFYSFWEYSRYCLKDESLAEEISTNSVSMDQPIILSPMISFSQIDSDLWQLYHLLNHHYVVGGSILYDLVNANEKKATFNELIQKYELPYRQKAETLVMHLARMNFFIVKE